MAKSKATSKKTRKKTSATEGEGTYYVAEVGPKNLSKYDYPEKEEPIVTSGSHKKAERISLRVSERHKKAITEASELAGFKNVNDYIIHISLVASQKVVREHKLLTLRGHDSIAFLDALQHSHKLKINETLQSAMDEFVAEQGR